MQTYFTAKWARAKSCAKFMRLRRVASHGAAHHIHAKENALTSQTLGQWAEPAKS